MEAAELFAPELNREMLVVTASVIPLLTVIVPVAMAVLLNVIELMLVLTVTVTLSPGLMITSSVEIGATPPDQVPPTFQGPLPLLVMSAALTSLAPTKAIPKRRMEI